MDLNAGIFLMGKSAYCSDLEQVALADFGFSNATHILCVCGGDCRMGKETEPDVQAAKEYNNCCVTNQFS